MAVLRGKSGRQFLETVDSFERIRLVARGNNVCLLKVKVMIGDCTCLLESVIDIAEHKKNRGEESQGMLTFLKTLIDTIPSPIFYKDVDGVYRGCNKAFEDYLGLKKEDLIGKSVYDLFPKDMADKYCRMDASLIHRKGKQASEDQVMHADGSIHDVILNRATYLNADGIPAGLVGVLVDITERKRMEAELLAMSLRDQLTEIYNRRGFINLAEQQIRKANRARRQMLLSFIDIDGMKEINDTLGHEEGDRALIDTANILRQTFRKSDIIARIGGDEFAVLAPDRTGFNPEILSKRIQQTIDDWNAKGYRPYRISLSWGTVIYDPKSPTTLDQLMSSSDELMYARKKAKISKSTQFRFHVQAPAALASLSAY